MSKLEATWAHAPSLHGFLSEELLKGLTSVEVGTTRVSLTEFQMQVWRALGGERSLALSAPTSAGKSFLTIEHLCSRAVQGSRFLAIYIAPTRALLAEVQAKIERRLGERTDTRVSSVPTMDAEAVPRQVFVLTQERLQILLGALQSEEAIDLVIVDEAQAIASGDRGMLLQTCLEDLVERFRVSRFLFLAPGVSNLGSLQPLIGIDDIESKETFVTPVVQNRICVTPNRMNERRLDLSLLLPDGSEDIGFLESERGFALQSGPARSAAVALELGRGGRSLVYATGPAKSEKLAQILSANLDVSENSDLEDLSKFIRKHIHDKYSLATYVRHGVGIHYGNMPAVLRNAIENAFRQGKLNYLACTTTLFHGVNLPAKSVFVDTPTRGNRGEELDEESLWNFAGRAGRLGDEVVGNVFLVDYQNWENQALNKRDPQPLQGALTNTLTHQTDDVVRTLESIAELAPSGESSDEIRAAAGLLIMRDAQGTLDQVWARSVPDMTRAKWSRLSKRVSEARLNLGLPASVLSANWLVDPVGMGALLRRIRQGLEDGEDEALIPINPSVDNGAQYRDLVFKFYKYLGGWDMRGAEGKKRRSFVSYVAACAQKWVVGQPLRMLVKQSVDFKKKQSSPKDAVQLQNLIDRAVRETFQLVEQVLRFKLVQWSAAYRDLLRVALQELGRDDPAFDVALALELGVSTRTARSLVELGLSRMAAVEVAALTADSAMSKASVREWLARENLALQALSGPIVAELAAKNLLSRTDT